MTAKRRRLFWVRSVLLVVSLATVGLFATDLVGGATAVGQPAPDVTLTTADGEFRLSERRGKVVVLYFSFPGWPTCALEAPALSRIQAESRDQGVEVVAINFSSLYPNLESWEYFWRKVGGGEDVRLAQDTDQRAFTAFNVRGLGTTIIINRDGQVIYRDAGPTPYDTLRSQVDKALQRPRFDAARR